VLGKYLGILCFLLIMLALIALMPFSLYLGTTLDFGQLCSALLGLFLLMSSFAAIGLFISSLTRQTAVAAITTFGALFVLWMLNLAADTGSETFQTIFTYLSLLRHYDILIEGIFNSVDVIYYLIISVTFIVLSIIRVDSQRI
ncbi:MAG: ABC transporter permease, partial [Gammaproteobacteria bacterium]